MKSKTVARRSKTFSPSDKTAILSEIRARFEREPRINLHRYPIGLSFSGDDLVLEGEAENVAAKKLLEKDPFVDASRIRVTTRKYVVTLAGLVRNERMGKIAERDAWCVFGVDGVINELEARE